MCNCNCLDPACGRLDCCCLQLRIKRVDAVTAQPGKEASSWSLSMEDHAEGRQPARDGQGLDEVVCISSKVA